MKTSLCGPCGPLGWETAKEAAYRLGVRVHNIYCWYFKRLIPRRGRRWDYRYYIPARPPQHNCKLTPADVRAIRALRGTISQSKLGLRFGVSARTIYLIQNRHTWRHLTP